VASSLPECGIFGGNSAWTGVAAGARQLAPG
jgi:hypothetical protein